MGFVFDADRCWNSGSEMLMASFIKIDWFGIGSA